ncbi:glutamine ABC transporter, periplasmic glutamine-binding protein [Agrilactobacillus composti DSM 18527 = JCM 14202]|nr:glutamine ABC transporter, periplasmic glutamine-binding protein [Agrilactobacillus composti DSM 18527 = JCM 14202]
MRLKKKNWLLIPMLLVLGLTVLAGCGQKSVASEDVLARDKANKTVVWGVKSDTRLFGLMDIKTNQIQALILISPRNYPTVSMGRMSKST